MESGTVRLRKGPTSAHPANHTKIRAKMYKETGGYKELPQHDWIGREVKDENMNDVGVVQDVEKKDEVAVVTIAKGERELNINANEINEKGGKLFWENGNN